MSSLSVCQRLSGIWKRLATTLRWVPARRRWCETVLTDLMLEGLAMDAMDSVWQLIPELAAWRERPLIVVMKPLPASLPVAFVGDEQADCLLVSPPLSSRRRDAAVLRVMAYLLFEEHARLYRPPANEVNAPYDSGSSEQGGAINAKHPDGIALIQMCVPWSARSHINRVRRWAHYVFLGKWSVADERMAQLSLLASLLERQWHIKRLGIRKERHRMQLHTQKAPPDKHTLGLALWQANAAAHNGPARPR